MPVFVVKSDFTALSVDGLAIVELLLLENANDKVLGDQSNESTSRVDHRVGIMLSLESFLAALHVGDGRESDDVLRHDL